MSNVPDPILLLQARAGDRAALEALLRGHEERLYNICLRLVRHPQDAADLTQDTFVQAITHLDQFDQRSQFGTWLTRIAMNQCFSHLRKAKVRRAVSLDQDRPDAGGQPHRLADDLADHRELSPQLDVQEKEMLERLHAAMGALDADHQAVLVLRDLEQMNYDDMAQTLDLPVGTVKSRLFRARTALREQMVASERDSDAKAGGA